MKSRKHLVAMIALVATVAVAVPTALAQTQEHDVIAEFFDPDIKGVTTAPDSFGEIASVTKIEFVEAMQLIDSKFDGVVIGSYLDDHRGYLVYFVNIIDYDGMYYTVILDAGTGDVLHESLRTPVVAIEQLFGGSGEEWEDEYSGYEDGHDGKDAVVQRNNGSS